MMEECLEHSSICFLVSLQKNIQLGICLVLFAIFVSLVIQTIHAMLEYNPDSVLR